MVCLPCIFLPVLMFIYIKFIQPYVYRILPESWVHFLDPILYPTCPAQPPQPAEADRNSTKETQPCCAGGDESKKDK